MENERDEKPAWHVDKTIPLTLLAALVCQTFALGAWTESISARLADAENRYAVQAAELVKLETAREATNIDVVTIKGNVEQLLNLARRNDTRNIEKDSREMEK